MAIKVMIVDDSAVMREVMQQLLAPHKDIEVIGAAMDPLLALQKMKTVWPDVILLDVEMPRMDGITFLRQIMATRPTPVVICSTLTEKGAAITLQALSAGAVEVITKPTMGLRDFLQDSAQEMLAAIRQSLKPGGKLLLIEFRGEDPEVAIKPLHKMTVKQAEKELTANGFKLVQNGQFMKIQHFLVFEKN